MERFTKQKEFVRHPANFKSAMGFPIEYNTEFIGCILCFSSTQGEKIIDEYNLLKEVIQLIGSVVKQKLRK